MKHKGIAYKQRKRQIRPKRRPLRRKHTPRPKGTAKARAQRWVLGVLAVIALSCWMSTSEEDGSFWPLDLLAPKQNKIVSENIKVLDTAHDLSLIHI